VQGLQRIDRKLKAIDQLFPAQVKLDWRPFPGAQSLAYYSPADELFYGGAPAGGKTDLILGLALKAHTRSLILRRRALDLAAIKVRFTEITGKIPATENRINGRYIQMGGCKDEGSKYKFQGQPHDLKAFDEVTQFNQTQYEYIKTWNRTALEGQRCRTVCSFNPPTSSEHRWVINYLSPWLDPKHHNPAQSGEIRYYIGRDEVDGPEPQNGITPIARCFILSSTSDNPLLMATGYDRILANLPPELAALTDFSAGIEDDPYQVIPTAWVELAQQRWRDRWGEAFDPMPVVSNIPQDAIAADIARGGIDQTTIATRHSDNVFIWGYPGKDTPDGATGAGKLLQHRRGFSRISIDVIGWGSSSYDHIKGLGYDAIAFNGSNKSTLRDRSGQFGFANKRAEAHWKLREALDPEYGSTLALPPLPKLLSDLTAPRWFLSLRGIQVEEKSEIKKRLGRSPDYGDAVVMVCDVGALVYGSAF
jgi:hypothetical protein